MNNNTEIDKTFYDLKHPPGIVYIKPRFILPK